MKNYILIPIFFLVTACFSSLDNHSSNKEKKEIKDWLIKTDEYFKGYKSNDINVAEQSLLKTIKLTLDCKKKYSNTKYSFDFLLFMTCSRLGLLYRYQKKYDLADYYFHLGYFFGYDNRKFNKKELDDTIKKLEKFDREGLNLRWWK